MDYSLGLLRNEDFTTARQRIKFYNHERQGGHLLRWMAVLLKSFCLLWKCQVLGSMKVKGLLIKLSHFFFQVRKFPLTL